MDIKEKKAKPKKEPKPKKQKPPPLEFIQKKVILSFK